MDVGGHDNNIFLMITLFIMSVLFNFVTEASVILTLLAKLASIAAGTGSFITFIRTLKPKNESHKKSSKPKK